MESCKGYVLMENYNPIMLEGDVLEIVKFLHFVHFAMSFVQNFGLGESTTPSTSSIYSVSSTRFKSNSDLSKQDNAISSKLNLC